MNCLKCCRHCVRVLVSGYKPYVHGITIVHVDMTAGLSACRDCRLQVCWLADCLDLSHISDTEIQMSQTPPPPPPALRSIV